MDSPFCDGPEAAQCRGAEAGTFGRYRTSRFCFTDVVLEPGYILRVWSTDLPQYYYRMKVSDERAKSNVFTEPLDAREFDDTQAVQRLKER